jgi:hypothetical protein
MESTASESVRRWACGCGESGVRELVLTRDGDSAASTSVGIWMW